MPGLLQRTVLVGALLVLTGCSGISGTWVLDTLEPQEEWQHYSLSQLDLNEDETYTAMAEKGEDDKFITGTYKYENNRLTLSSDKGDTHTFDAWLMNFDNKLKLQTKLNGQEMVAILSRAK